MDSPVIKELIQEDCSPQNIAAELNNILNNKTYREKMLADYDRLDEKMGKPGASAKTAALIIKYASKKIKLPGFAESFIIFHRYCRVDI